MREGSRLREIEAESRLVRLRSLATESERCFEADSFFFLIFPLLLISVSPSLASSITTSAERFGLEANRPRSLPPSLRERERPRKLPSSVD
mmetsp:Transcript_23792/g.39305  ORF Transcript_23792/g.39305 Transcript_23792/m.39305 type:complete len:91 (+) Transcript_23792:445-717(+)